MRSDPRAMLLDGTAARDQAVDWRNSFSEIVGRSPAMMKVLEMVAKVARTDSSVLILGESGTGKELIAAAIHRLSARSGNRFVPLNCSAIPETLLESELFGHEKGAFTGADKRKSGTFEYAQRGTLFLDEIGDMPAPLQAKLLRVLQDKKFVLVGSNKSEDADVRIIAATHIDLENAIGKGSFRKDLYYRLNVLPIQLPALRERPEDIPELVLHFVNLANRSTDSEPCFLTDRLIERMCSYSWPGNVRQLKNIVERLVVVKGGGAIDVDDLPHELLITLPVVEPVASHAAPLAPPHPAPMQPVGHPMRSHVAQPLPRPFNAAAGVLQMPDGFGKLPDAGFDLTKFIEDLENDLIRQALERTGNNRNQAARLLGLNRTTLVERIKKRRLTTLNEPSKEL